MRIVVALLLLCCIFDFFVFGGGGKVQSNHQTNWFAEDSCRAAYLVYHGVEQQSAYSGKKCLSRWGGTSAASAASASSAHKDTHTHTCVYMYTYIEASLCIYIYREICIYTHIRMCMYVYIHMYTNTSDWTATRAMINGIGPSAALSE